jgi:hypothetical protein
MSVVALELDRAMSWQIPAKASHRSRRRSPLVSRSPAGAASCRSLVIAKLHPP